MTEKTPEVEALEKRLAEPIPDDRISQRKGPKGPLRYLKAGHAILGMNEIFGTLGWSHAVVDIMIPEKTAAIKTIKSQKPGGKTIERQGYTACAVARVEVLVGPPDKPIARHMDVGSSSSDMQPTMAGAIQNATKAAASDGLKRAVRVLGARLGLAMYFDEDEAEELGMTGEGLPPDEDDAGEYPTPKKEKGNDQAEELGAAMEDAEALAVFGKKVRGLLLAEDPPTMEALKAVNGFLLERFGDKKKLVRAAWTSVGVEFEDGKPAKAIRLGKYKALAAFLKGAEQANKKGED